MLPVVRARLHPILSRRLIPSTQARNATTKGTTGDNPIPANVPPSLVKDPPPSTSGTPVPTSSTGSGDRTLQEMPEKAEERRVMQSPNRKSVWSRSQNPREMAMSGPRFEQTIMEDQPRPYAAIDLIHKQPVRWTKERQVSCDGGGGPLGHPRIFINVDKPMICMCTYCGLPFANEHNREHIEAQPYNTYPLEALGDAAEVPTSQRVTKDGPNEPYGQR